MDVAPHPRLFLSGADIAALRNRLGIPDGGPPEGADPYLCEAWAEVRACAEAMLPEAPSELVASAEDAEAHSWGINLRQARRSQQVIVWTAFVHLLTGSAEYAQRAKREVSSVLAWGSWVDPVHLPLRADLMTGEVCFGVGVAYDWLWEALSEQERDEIRTGLLTKGLEPYMQAVEDGAFWARCPHNWNAMVNGGCAVAAMALLGEWEDAERCLERARDNLDVFFDAIPPDGGWREGVSHWRYGMHYAMCFAAALRGVLGSDDEIILRDGVRNTGYFPIYFTGPDGEDTDFGEALPDAPGTAVLHYLSMRTGRREFGRWRQRQWSARHGERTKGRARTHPFDLLWSRTEAAVGLELPASACFWDTGWAVLRSSWDDDEALYVAIRSGELKATEDHLGLNSFILVAGGERFVVDAASSESETASTRAHNTLVIDGRDQEPQAAGRITDFFSSPQYAAVTADATEAYGDAASAARRHFVMVGEGRDAYLVVLDEVELRREAKVEWTVHTPFAIAASGQEARLCGEEGDLLVSVVAPEQGTLEALVEQPPAGIGIPALQQRHVALRMDAEAGAVHVLALLRPVGRGGAAPSVQPISADNCRGVALQGEGALDRLLVRTSAEGDVEAQGIYFDGQKAFARTRDGGGLEWAVLENGVSLTVDREFLLGAQRPVSAAVDLSAREGDGIVRARCWASGRTGLSFSVWDYPEEVRVNGRDVEIDAVGGMVSVVLEHEGDHEVEVRLGKAAVSG